MKYRKKPVIIEAVQFDRSKAEEDVAKYYPMVTDLASLTTALGVEECEGRFFISTLERSMTVKDGDYIIQGVEGEFYPCKPDIFEKTYEEASQQTQLDDNQKVVLEWLKQTAPTGKPMQVVFWMMNNAAWGHLDELRDPLMELTDKQQFEVLAAFAQWGLEQEEVG
ncbi:hypothetical protein [Enterococcus faecium]|uniref:hypothetical protein n=1 Tax=Enterococcus faecium TaxID=1352 RepID=UPI001D01EA96|nr:hypothetical protein [Enterococcus faecium]